MARRTVHLIISGDVQGVGYRAWAVNLADEMGVDGWIRNLAEDGTVEAMFSGEEELVDSILEECRCGPSAANVEDVIIEEIDDEEVEEGFYSRATA